MMHTKEADLNQLGQEEGEEEDPIEEAGEEKERKRDLAREVWNVGVAWGFVKKRTKRRATIKQKKSKGNKDAPPPTTT